MSNIRISVLFPVVFVGILIACAGPARSQHLTRWCPSPITIRGCAISPTFDDVFVGDSSYILMSVKGFWAINGYFDRSVTLHAACYADDQDVAVAGSKGRIYYSTNDGTHWSVGTSGTTATIRSMATDENGYYFAVGDSGLILESSDLGKSWTRLASPTTKQLNAIEFGPSGQYAVAVGNDSAIVVSTDDGATWNVEPMQFDLSPLGGSLQRVDFSAVAISLGEDSVWVGLERPVLPLLYIRGKADPKQQFTVFPNSGPLTALLYVGDSGSFYLRGEATDDYEYWLTKDGAYTQEPSYWGFDADGKIDTTAYRIECAAVELLGGGHWRATYAGEDLTIWNDAYFQAGYLGRPFSADYLDADVQNGVGYLVATQGKIDWIDDGGTSRALRVSGTVTINSVWQRNGILAFATGWSGTILRTNDSGVTWDSIPSGTQERLQGIAFPTAKVGIITGDAGTILRSTDTGNSWSPVPSATTIYAYLRSVGFSDDHTGIAVGDSGTILRTTDTGLTWQPINNFLTGTDVSIRKLQAFPGGLYYAQAGTDLVRSTDAGVNWSVLPSPGDAIAMSFYNSQIGLIGSRVTSSELVPDTVYMSYTTDGGATWTPFVVPILNQRRLAIYWLNDHQAVLNGDQGNVTEVTISTSGVTLSPLSAVTSNVRICPNPISGDFRVSYTTKSSGPVTIQLFSEDGKDMGTLLRGTEPVGEHEQPLTAPQELHGSYYIRITEDGTSQTVPVSLR